MTMPLTKSLRGATKPVAERTGFLWTLRDLFRRRSAQIGGAIVLLLVLMAIFAPVIAPYDPYAINVTDRLHPPSLTYPFGTDDLGRDLFSRIIYGARTTIQTGVVVVFIAASLGSLIGLISGYYGGVVDLVIMRVIDIMRLWRRWGQACKMRWLPSGWPMFPVGRALCAAMC